MANIASMQFANNALNDLNSLVPSSWSVQMSKIEWMNSEKVSNENQ